VFEAPKALLLDRSDEDAIVTRAAAESPWKALRPRMIISSSRWVRVSAKGLAHLRE
jgi:hypothetical protein